MGLSIDIFYVKSNHYQVKVKNLQTIPVI